MKSLRSFGEFFYTIITDSFALYPRFLLELGIIKIIKLLVLAFSFVQVLLLGQKFFVLGVIEATAYTVGMGIFLLLIFPLLYMLEKFYAMRIIGSFYENPTATKLETIKEKLKEYPYPQSWWLVYLLSQGKMFIDFGFFFIFVFLYYFISGFSIWQVVLLFMLFTVLAVACVIVWRVSAFLFAFWNEENTLFSAFVESYTFSGKKRFPIILKYIVFRTIELLLIFIALFAVYKLSLHVLVFTFLQNFLPLNISFYLTAGLILLVGSLLYLFLSLYDAIFWTRSFAYVKGESRNIVKNSHYNSSIYVFIQLFLFLMLLAGIFFYAYKNISDGIEAVSFISNNKTDFQKLIKINGDLSVQNTSQYIDTSLAKGENGLAFNLVFKNGIAYVEPLQTLPKSIILDGATSLLPNTSFDLYQKVGRQNEISNLITFHDMYEKVTTEDRAMFVYISDSQIDEESFTYINKMLETKQSYYLVVFSNDEEAMKILHENFPNLRTGIIASTLDVPDYPHRTFFTLYDDVENVDLKKASDKNIKVYVIQKIGQSIGSELDLKSVQGVLSPDTGAVYTQQRSRELRDYYTSYLNIPLKIFGL